MKFIHCAPWLLAASLLTACSALAPAPKRDFDLQAHRGGRALAPENTLAAFDNAMEMGVTTLELDIGLTADGVVVISHDTVLNPEHTRDANGAFLTAKGPAIRALTLAQLQTYDVGRIDPATHYGKQFALQVPRDGRKRFTGMLRRADGESIEMDVDNFSVSIRLAEISRARLAPL